jgi:hypothetical protein
MEDADVHLTEARKAGFRSEDFRMGFLNRFTEDQILKYLRYHSRIRQTRYGIH